MSLSTLELIRIVASVLDTDRAYEKFVEELMNHRFQIPQVGPGPVFDGSSSQKGPSVYYGWEGIDSEFCVMLIHYSIEHMKGKTLVLSSFKKPIVSVIYSRVYDVYGSACQSIKLPFIPCIKGLGTVLRKRK